MSISPRAARPAPFAGWLLALLCLALLAGCSVTPAPLPTATPMPATDTPLPPTATLVPPTDTPVPPTETPVPPTATRTPKPATTTPTEQPPTATAAPVADTPAPSPTVQAAATTAVPATSKPAAAGSPKGVLYYSAVNWDADRWELWQYNFATGAASFMKEWRTEVAFTANYQQIAYYGWPAALGENAGIYIAAPDLSGERLVISGGAYPSFSPDGSRLVVNGGETMFILNSDGSSLHPFDDGEYPAWSPKDSWIAHRGCYGADCGLWLTHADSGERRRLTTGGSDGQPAWAPDAKRLVYISKDDGNFEIYVIGSDGSNKVRLTNDEHSDGLPTWSPDGQWIAFRSDRDGAWAIYAMRPDGSDVRRLCNGDVLPVWFWEKMSWRP